MFVIACIAAAVIQPLLCAVRDVLSLFFEPLCRALPRSLPILAL
jgi:hypothetical protein